MALSYELRDTFNDSLISRHRTLAAAVKARTAHSAGVKKYHGPSSYIPTEILHNGERVDPLVIGEEMDRQRGY